MEVGTVRRAFVPHPALGLGNGEQAQDHDGTQGGNSYDQAFQLCSQACTHYGWYNRNCAINPVLVEGKKTGGLEIAEQCADFGGVPD